MSIGVILTCWRRPENLPRQYAAVQAQSLAPSRIAIWQNFAAGVPPIEQAVPEADYIRSNYNWGVWPRFLLAMELDTEYVCIFDDDTIPGRRWLENCLTSMRQREGLYGTVGVVFHKRGQRNPHYRVGWSDPNEQTTEVDIVGHSWFFKRDWLRHYCLEPRHGGPTCGEDYHFAVAFQKHKRRPTLGPPHPADNRELWGSLEGMALGTQKALWDDPGQPVRLMDVHKAYLQSGWKPLALRT